MYIFLFFTFNYGNVFLKVIFSYELILLRVYETVNGIPFNCLIFFFFWVSPFPTNNVGILFYVSYYTTEY